MHNKHRKTLDSIFAKPTQATLEWAAIEKLLIAVGCQIIEGRGSRVRFVYGDTVATFHRPHPLKESKPYQVEQAREFLKSIGVTP